MNRAEREQTNLSNSNLQVEPNRSVKKRQAGTLREGDELQTKRQRLAGEAPRPGTELASYRVSSGERLLICAGGKGGLDIHDVAADLLGETYRVERAFEDETALWAVVDDYLAQAKRFDAPPMSGAALATVMLKRDD